MVETGYSYKWEVPGSSVPVDYPYSEAGQDEFVKDLVKMLLRHPQVNGLFWWWLEYNAYNTTLTGLYNAPLFDSTTGCALEALHTLCSFASGASGLCAPSPEYPAGPTIWYDLQGKRVTNPRQGIILITSDGKKVL